MQRKPRRPHPRQPIPPGPGASVPSPARPRAATVRGHPHPLPAPSRKEARSQRRPAPPSPDRAPPSLRIPPDAPSPGPKKLRRTLLRFRLHTRKHNAFTHPDRNGQRAPTRDVPRSSAHGPFRRPSPPQCRLRIYSGGRGVLMGQGRGLRACHLGSKVGRHGGGARRVGMGTGWDLSAVLGAPAAWRRSRPTRRPPARPLWRSLGSAVDGRILDRERLLSDYWVPDATTAQVVRPAPLRVEPRGLEPRTS